MYDPSCVPVWTGKWVVLRWFMSISQRSSRQVKNVIFGWTLCFPECTCTVEIYTVLLCDQPHDQSHGDPVNAQGRIFGPLRNVWRRYLAAELDQSRDQSREKSRDQSRDHHVTNHVIITWPITSSSHDQSRDHHVTNHVINHMIIMWSFNWNVVR